MVMVLIGVVVIQVLVLLAMAETILNEDFHVFPQSNDLVMP